MASDQSATAGKVQNSRMIDWEASIIGVIGNFANPVAELA